MDPRPILRSNFLYLSDETCFPLCWLGGRLLISCTSRALYFLRFGLTNSFKEEDIFGVPGFVMSCSLVLGNPGTECSLVKELHGEDRPLTKPLHDDGRGRLVRSRAGLAIRKPLRLRLRLRLTHVSVCQVARKAIPPLAGKAIAPLRDRVATLSAPLTRPLMSRLPSSKTARCSLRMRGLRSHDMPPLGCGPCG